jgi:hypothetical protein
LKEAPAVLCTQKNLGYKEKQTEEIKARKKERRNKGVQARYLLLLPGSG